MQCVSPPAGPFRPRGQPHGFWRIVRLRKSTKTLRPTPRREGCGTGQGEIERARARVTASRERAAHFEFAPACGLGLGHGSTLAKTRAWHRTPHKRGRNVTGTRTRLTGHGRDAKKPQMSTRYDEHRSRTAGCSTRARRGKPCTCAWKTAIAFIKPPLHGAVASDRERGTRTSATKLG